MRKRREIINSRKLLPTLHVFSEGKESEKNYIELFVEKFCNSSKRIKIEKRSHTDPKGLVGEAINMRKTYGVSFPNDEYWAVYDRESPTKHSDKTHEQALRMAAEGGVNVALSNVCFEVWLLLHKADHDLKCNTCDELRKKPLFRRYFKDYNKGAKQDISKKEIIEARKRALAMNRRTLSGANREITENMPHKLNPYTMFPKLLDAIERFVL